FIISQRKSIPAIRRCVQQLCLRAGAPIRHAGGGFFAFPTPRRLAGLSMGELAACGLGYRAGYVHEAARLAASGALDLAALRRAESPALQQALLAVPGVGVKVANCVMLFGYHRLDGFPRDVWINRVIDEEYGGHFELAPYAGFEGVIQQYMFYYGRLRAKGG
ncbi:MAG: DNA-3-methyladenine glycosylase family protein, partial [Ruthenibacterium sp.]